MNTYLLVKWLHILSATVLFGTGAGIAFFKWSTDRSGNVSAIRVVAERTVLADWLFTTPAIVLQPISGLALVHLAGYPLFTGWVFVSLCLYLLAVCCWIPVVWLQLRMRAIARTADREHAALAQPYWAHTKTWFWLGVLAFVAFNAVFFLMVLKPAI